MSSEVRDVDGVALTGLTDTQRQQAMARFEILRPCIEDGVPLTRSGPRRRRCTAHRTTLAV